MKHTIKFRMGTTEYRSVQEIDHMLDKVKEVWKKHNHLSLGQLIKGLAFRRDVPVRNLSDIVMINIIEAELHETD